MAGVVAGIEVPLVEPQKRVQRRMTGDLGAHLRHLLAKGLGPGQRVVPGRRGPLGRRRDGPDRTDQRVIGVVVPGEEVERQVVAVGIIQQRLYPWRVGKGESRSAYVHGNTPAHVAGGVGDGCGRLLVELQVVGERARPEEAVGLVPHLEGGHAGADLVKGHLVHERHPTLRIGGAVVGVAAGRTSGREAGGGVADQDLRLGPLLAGERHAGVER